MSERPLSIVQINASERGGGAEAVALHMHEGLRRRGQHARLLVGRGDATAPDVHAFPADWRTRALHMAAGGARLVERYRGLETYRYPATASALRRYADADVVHLHNLHGGYFDLRELPRLSRRVPVVLTLHDAWLLSGHCAHSFACERWRTGCGACPDLTIYPAVRRDATALNWQRKRRIFAQSKLHIATPSDWLARRVRASMLAPAIAELRVIPNGVAVSVFTPGDRNAARSALQLPLETALLLFVGSAGANSFRDRATAEAAAARAAELMRRAVTLVLLGDPAVSTQRGEATIIGRPFEPDAARLAQYYQAADIYVHAAHADTFPTTMLEAMASGAPAVATATGGLIEQVRSLHACGAAAGHAAGDATGILVPAADPERMAHALAELLDADALRNRLGENAARIARAEYDAEQQCDTYLQWYRTLTHSGVAVQGVEAE